MSINCNQYFILIIDNAIYYITVAFLKTKDQAAQIIKNYLTYLKTHNKPPCAICTDRGCKFLNDQLRSWCQGKGIKMQTTAPYSPSQNGIMEHMNHILVELACMMLITSELPKFM
jgi:transposase InsO family protein